MKPSEKKTPHTERIQDLCKTAWDYTKQNPTKKLRGIKSRPWVLLLGKKDSGKTQLLLRSEIPLESPYEPASTSEKQTTLLDCWVGNDAVFIDPSGRISMPDGDEETRMWHTLLNTISRYRSHRSISHVVLVVDLPTLVETDKKKYDDYVKQLSEQLSSIQKFSKVIPVTLVFSKCDQLIGFSEYFDDMSTSERNQRLGIAVKHPTSFNQQYEQLMQRIRQRTIQRLHRERSDLKRPYIQSFPAQMEKLGHRIETFICALPFNQQILLTGIYFTSTTQKEATIDLLAPNMAERFGLQKVTTPSFVKHSHTFFTKSLLEHICQVAAKPVFDSSENKTGRLFALPIAAGLILGFTLLWHVGYNQTIKAINKTQTILNHADTNIQKNLTWLSTLNRLGDIIDNTSQHKYLHYRWIGQIQTYQIFKISEKKYKLLLHSQFLPYLKSTLITQIRLGLKGDKLALFDALKTYLSMTQSSRYSKNLIMGWYQTYWNAIYANKPTLRAKLQQHLFYLLNSNETLWTANAALVKQAQVVLQKLSISDLAFLELQGEYSPAAVPIFPNNHITGFSLEHATVPDFFSSRHFKEIYNQKIPHIGDILARGNWVLGTEKGLLITKKEQVNLTKQIRKMYLKFYASTWANTITNIQLIPQTTLSGTQAQIQQITNLKSPLMQLIKVIMGNAELDGGASAQANKNLLAVKQFMYVKSDREKIIPSFKNLNLFLDKINKAKSPDKASYEAASSRFQNKGANDPITNLLHLAKKYQEPLSSWMHNSAMNSWRALLSNAHTYINKIWRTLAIPVYENEIRERYPVFSDSDENISLKNFNDFFGSNGTVGAFFIYYLQPFINMESNFWTPKSLNGMTIGISRSALNTFIRASLIQQMFFTDDHTAASFRFTLAPISLSANLKQVTINFGGQIYSIYHHTHKKMKQFFWPGADATYASVTFTTKDGKTQTIKARGSWSLFRLIDQSSLTTTVNPMQYTLTFKAGNDTASFILITDQRVNPFIPGVISKYRCPDKL